MSHCWICKTVAEMGRDSLGDFRQCDCPRCGNYKITNSALAMLSSRFESDEIKSRARCSHAVRLMVDASPHGVWPEISSINLDALVNKPLPSIPNQILHLLNWAAKQLGDDQLGALDLIDEDHLAGIIGTIDGGRVDALISLAREQGFVEWVPDNCIRVTAKGWQQIEPVIEPVVADDSAKIQASSESETSVTKAHCNNCGGKRKALVRATFSSPGSDTETSWQDTYDILECCGCEQLKIRHDFWFSEWDEIGEDEHGNPCMIPGVKTTYWPPPIKRKKPDWSAKISDPVLRSLFEELYAALSSDLLILSTIGARTLFDRASSLKVGDPAGGFKGKLQAMQAAGHISADENRILEAMTDAGNASAHRGYAPTFEQLSDIVNILENYMERAFILGDVATTLKSSTPLRPTRKKP